MYCVSQLENSWMFPLKELKECLTWTLKNPERVRGLLTVQKPVVTEATAFGQNLNVMQTIHLWGCSVFFSRCFIPHDKRKKSPKPDESELETLHRRSTRSDLYNNADHVALCFHLVVTNTLSQPLYWKDEEGHLPSRSNWTGDALPSGWVCSQWDHPFWLIQSVTHFHFQARNISDNSVFTRAIF